MATPEVLWYVSTDQNYQNVDFKNEWPALEIKTSGFRNQLAETYRPIAILKHKFFTNAELEATEKQASKKKNQVYLELPIIMPICRVNNEQ